MKLAKLTILLLISAVPVAAQNPESWQLVRACGITFRLPANMQSVKTYPVDSCVKHYRSADLDLELDVIYSPHTPRSEALFRDSSSGEPQFEITEIEVAGVRSFIKTYYKSAPPKEKDCLHYFSALLLPSIGPDRHGLMMWIHGRQSTATGFARKIYQSIALRQQRRA
jgi:hypothetical protein